MTRPGARKDEPLLLADAAALYTQARLTVRTLRSERDKGLLDTFMIGKREYTTLADLDRMIERCRARSNRPAFGSAQPAPAEPPPGSSSTQESRSARAAALASVKRLKKLCRTTSAKSASGTSGEVIRPKFGSQTC